MYPKLKKSDWESIKQKKPIISAFNALGSLKIYKNTEKTLVCVVVSSKYEKSAVKRNLLKRRVYSLLNLSPLKKGVYIVFPSKNAYKSSFFDIKKLFAELYEKSS